MSAVSFQDKFLIKLTGSGALTEELTEYYGDLLSDTVPSGVDLTCRVAEFDLNPTYVLGKPNTYYGRNGDWFIKKDKYKKVRIKHDWSEINFSPNVPKGWVYKLLEYRARVELAKHGQSLVHASGVSINGTTITFPAWRHTGKTNTLIALLKKYEADYLSDDRLWVGKDGSAYGFPLPINLQPYNYNAFPGIDPPTQFYDQRYRLTNAIRNRTSDTGPFFTQALYFLNEFYIAPPSKKVRIKEVQPNVGYIDEAEIDAFVCLQTVSKKEEEVSLMKISSDRAVDYIRSISQREWNGVIQEYVSAFDLLFEDEYAEREFEKLKRRETEIWREATQNVETYLLTIPREEQWNEKGLSREVLDELAPLVE